MNYTPAGTDIDVDADALIWGDIPDVSALLTRLINRAATIEPETITPDNAVTLARQLIGFAADLTTAVGFAEVDADLSEAS